VLDFDDFDLEADAPRVPRTKADVDIEVWELSRERRLAMAARRAADVFSWVSMPATAALLRELAEAADSFTSAASAFLEPE
jgi:hypothetical protein